MIYPQQTLLHLTSKGSNVRGQGIASSFINESKQPLNNINKFGLLHYSIPKTLDLVDVGNSTFQIKFTYTDGHYVTVPVRLPLLDYFTTFVDSHDRGLTDTVYPGEICLTEILQTTINWAIQRYSTENNNDRVNRFSCVVKTDEKCRLEFYFGYRGNVHTITQDDLDDAKEKEKYPTATNYTLKVGDRFIKANSGGPWPANRGHVPNEINDWPGICVQATNKYNWLDIKATNQTDFFEVPVDLADDIRDQFQLASVQFTGIAPRLQFMFGLPAPANSITSSQSAKQWEVDRVTGVRTERDSRVVSRGRINLVNYDMNKDLERGTPFSRIVKLSMPAEPNVSPPSFLFLNLTTQGTKTRVLGHSAERGGWAVPCDAAEFRSIYNNIPWLKSNSVETKEYDINQVRNMPMLINLKDPKLAKLAAKGGPHDFPIFYRDADQGTTGFDPAPVNPTGIACSTDDGDEWLCENDWSLVADTDNNTNDPAGAAPNFRNQFKFGSRFIHYGSLDVQPRAAQREDPRTKFGPDNRGMAVSPCFTVSMITPSWIYTDVPNSTVQTLDVQLMWGDTNQNVIADAPQPCQLSLIASQ